MEAFGKANGDLGEILRRTAVDPYHFAELIAAWNAEFDPENGLHGSISLEATADRALRDIESGGEGDIVGHQLVQVLNSLPHSVVLAGADGVVRGLNTSAMARLDLGVGDSIDALPYQLEAAESMSKVIRSIDRAQSAGEIIVRHAVHAETDRPAMIAFVRAPPRPDRAGSALLFVIDPEQREEAEALMSRAYGLTPAEAEIVTAFLEGNSLPAIAEQRGRSLATVRTQFQSAMSKSGARSQAEMMRNALGLSQFVSEISELADVARHPHRKAAQILRPGGRTVDVLLAGDMSGEPVVFLSTLTHHALPARVEACLREARLMAVHIWRPGFGRTDPPAAGATRSETLAGDLAALLSQLGEGRCVLVGLNAATPVALELGRLCPDLISRILVVGPVLPRPYQRRETIGTPWAEAIYRTLGTNPVLLRVMVRVGLRAWKVLGTRRFSSLQLGDSTADIAVLDQPGVLAELDRAMVESNAQGIEANVQDAQRIIADWCAVAERCRVPIELIHGIEDPCTNITCSRAFAADFPDRVTLTEIPGGGFYTLFSHTDAVMSRMVAATQR